MLTEQEIRQPEEFCFDGVSDVGGNLFVSGSDFKNKSKNIKNNNIIAILSIGCHIDDYDECFSPHSFVNHHKFIELGDEPEARIINYFDECNEFIDKHIENGGVLIHCAAGISRSATIVTAYILNKYPYLPTDTVIYYLRSKRCVVDPNYGFRTQLDEYQNKLLGENNLFKLIEYNI